MINARLNWWLEHNNIIITPCQAGFRSNYTTEHQLIRLTQTIGFPMNKDTNGDLEKSYDKVWRQGLFTNMRDSGIHTNIQRWTNTFPADSRTTATQTEGVTSSNECLKEGIPQGSSFTSTPFPLYIVKYLPDKHAALYADDIVLLWGDRQANSRLQRTEM